MVIAITSARPPDAMMTEITQIRTPAEKALISLYASEKDRLPGNDAVKALRA